MVCSVAYTKHHRRHLGDVGIASIRIQGKLAGAEDNDLGDRNIDDADVEESGRVAKNEPRATLKGIHSEYVFHMVSFDVPERKMRFWTPEYVIRRISVRRNRAHSPADAR